MFLRHPLALLISASVLAGCAVGPEYKKPEVSLPDHFMGQAQLEHRNQKAIKDMVSWWDGFDDPLLSRFVSLALEQNLDIAQALARIAQAKSGMSMAQAALLPSIDGTAQGTRVHQSLETPLGQLLNNVPGYDRNASMYETNLVAAWELDIFGGLRREREAAMSEYLAAKAGGDATRLAVAAQTADIYITIRSLQTRLDINRKQLQTQQDLLSKVSILYQRGLAPKLQVQQTEGALSHVKASIPMIEAGLDTAMNALDVLLGAAPGAYRSDLGQPTPIPLAPQVNSIGSPADLLQRRPDLMVAEQRLKAANAKIGVATSEYYPKFGLNVLLGSATAISSGNLFSSNANQAAGVLGLRWRLFDFGRINAQIDLAKGKELEALSAYRQAALRATEDVENSISALIKRDEQVEALTQGELFLQQARESSFTAYQKGVSSLIDVLHADETLLRTADARAQAQTEAAHAAVAMFKALGGGWTNDGFSSQASSQVNTAKAPN